jgi:hypothetical protein
MKETPTDTAHAIAETIFENHFPIGAGFDTKEVVKDIEPLLATLIANTLKQAAEELGEF